MSLSNKALYDVHKLVFLANEYPNKTIRELGSLFTMGSLDINAAIWRARELGYLMVDEQTGYYKVEKTPETWEFGPEVEYLTDATVYVLSKIAETEQDMEENAFASWVVGHASHDVAVTLRYLVGQHKIAFYEITTNNDLELSKKAKGRGKQPQQVESTYTFYSLWENAEQQWGKKQFADQSKLK